VQNYRETLAGIMQYEKEGCEYNGPTNKLHRPSAYTYFKIKL